MKRFRSILLFLVILSLAACGTNRQAGTSPAASPTTAQLPATPALTASPAATATAGPPSGPLQVTNPGAPDVADYAIAVRLDPQSHQLNGRETITYRNTTTKPFSELVFHLYLNAFKSQDTVFMTESGGQLRGDEFDPQNNGWIDVKSLRLKDGTALKLELIQDGTLAHTALPKSVGPGGQIELELDFQAQLPRVFARTGWALDNEGDPFFLAGQWFPKLGVWTESGWNAYVFHGNAEFFADFGTYRVAITLPESYVSGATGLERGKVKNGNGTQTVTYQAAGVIDFAWVASPNLRSAATKAGDVEIVYLYLPEHEWSRNRELDNTVKSVSQYSDWFGPYPYARLTVVDVPNQGSGAGGMEYPTFITVGAAPQGSPTPPPSGWTDGLLITTAHEVAHQWWQSMVATNEAAEPWLDEGFADTSTLLLLSKDHPLDPKSLDEGSSDIGYFFTRRNRYLQDPGVPMDKKSWDYNYPDYVIAAYAKPDMSLLTLGRENGNAQLLAILHAYFERYRFAHPTTADFQKVATEVSGQNLDWFFNGLVYNNRTINYSAQSIDGSSFTIDRQGELVIPVELLVRFKDGSTQTVTWDGSDTTHTFKLAKAIQSIDIDPEHKLLIEVNWKDNEIEAK